MEKKRESVRNVNKRYKHMETPIKTQQDYAQKLALELGITNVMRVPKIQKIVVNMGVKDATVDKKNVDRGQMVLSLITGQKPKIAKAKKSIAGFKLREGQEIGVVVTLRGKRMRDFLGKITNIVLPRLRDFRGVPKKSFDGHGNYTLGISEYTVFPEIDPGKFDRIQGFEIVIVTTAQTDQEGRALLTALGMPFEKEQ